MALKKYRFIQLCSDYSLFSLKTFAVEVHVLVYVDDLVIGGNDSEAICRFKAYLNRCFFMKDLGRLKYFLGLEVVKHPTDIFLSQRKYTLDILSEVGLLGARPATTPIEQNHRLALTESDDLHNPEAYRRLVG